MLHRLTLEHCAFSFCARLVVSWIKIEVHQESSLEFEDAYTFGAVLVQLLYLGHKIGKIVHRLVRLIIDAATLACCYQFLRHKKNE